MKVKRSFPLTSVETVDYGESSDPKKFRITFSNCIEILQAQTVEDANDWVEKIVQGESYSVSPCLSTSGFEFSLSTACAKWHVSLVEDSPLDEISAEKPESTDMQDAQSSIHSITRLATLT